MVKIRNLYMTEISRKKNSESLIEIDRSYPILPESRIRDFTVKTKRLSRNMKAKRQYLNDPKTVDLIKKL